MMYDSVHLGSWIIEDIQKQQLFFFKTNAWLNKNKNKTTTYPAWLQ